MSEAIAFLLWLVFVGISAILIGFFLKYNELPFTSKEGFTTSIYGCPAGTTNYVTKKGATNCCNGDVVDGVCTGNNQCTLSPNNRDGLPTCAQLQISNAAVAAAALCPTAIPNYFISADETLRGCSVSRITLDGTAPQDQSQLQCILYPTSALDNARLDSCRNYLANQAALSAAACPAPIPTLPTSFTPVKGTVLLNSFEMTPDYDLEFDITPTGPAIDNWMNIIHFTSNDADYGEVGSRSPAIWFTPKTFNLHVRIGDSSDPNYGFDSAPGCSLNKQSHVILRCKGKNVTLFVDSNVYTLGFIPTATGQRYRGPVKVYGSDPTWPTIPCTVDNLRLHKY